MCGGETIVGDFGDVQISQFGDSFHKEDIGAFEVSMYDVVFVQTFESFE